MNDILFSFCSNATTPAYRLSTPTRSVKSRGDDTTSSIGRSYF